MSSSQAFVVVLLRSISIGVRRAIAGTQIAVDAQTCAHMIRCHDARLADEDDLPRLAAALQVNGKWLQPATR